MTDNGSVDRSLVSAAKALVNAHDEVETAKCGLSNARSAELDAVNRYAAARDVYSDALKSLIQQSVEGDKK